MKPIVARFSIAVAVAVLLAGYTHRSVQGQSLVPTVDAGPVTFNKNIAPILFRHCVECHRPGEVAPFSLLTHADAKKRASMIQAVTSKRIMPPWKSVEGHGSFVGERRLAAEEIERIARWVKQGAPEGAPQDLPDVPRFTEGWKLGQPDIVVKMPEAFEVPAEGRDVYRSFVFAFDVPKGKYIKAAEFRPSNRRVVHHAQLNMDVTDHSRKKDEADPALGFDGTGNVSGQLLPGSMATWTPGRDAVPLPDGMSMPWKPGADFVLQLHLHPTGTTEVEQSSVGFYLTDQPPKRSMVDLLLIDMKIDIPPGERSYRTRAELTLPIDVEAVGIFPHMHVIGREFKLTAYPPQGESFSLLWIDDWDFNWQVYYQYATSMKLAAGTRIVMDAVHDNSADNINNPSDPPKRVKWGEQTTDEMSLAFLQVMPAREEDFGKFGVKEGGKLGVIRAVDFSTSLATPGESPPTTTAADTDEKVVAGNWKLTYDPGDGKHEATLTITKIESDLKGTFVDGDKEFEVVKIDFNNGKLSFSIRTQRDGMSATSTFEGKVKGDALKGDANWEYQGMNGSFPFEGKREAAKPEEEKNATHDPLYQEPYVDLDELRDKPVRHRYVHGGFKGTEARFSIYFPHKEQYQGRFFQHITPIPSSENLAQQDLAEDNKIGFSIASGGYFVETNEGGMAAMFSGNDPAIAGYRVNAAVARYSRVLATTMYGPHRTYGYAWGGSGGAFRTIGGFENSNGAWDGVVPYVMGSPMAIPNVYTSRILAMRVLKDKFPTILDAVEPGGGGDMYSGLTKEERDVLAEVTRMGFPPRGWYNHKTLGMGAFTILYGMVVQKDPKYFEEFWTVPGYAGANPPESLVRDRVQHRTTIKSVLKAEEKSKTYQGAAPGGVDAWQQLQGACARFQVGSAPTGNLEMATLIVKSGEATGKVFPIQRVVGDIVLIGSGSPIAMMSGGGVDAKALENIKSGDEVQIDNSNFLAVQYYHRYQVPTLDYYVWNQFRRADGEPIFPQRPKLLGPEFNISASGSIPSGRFNGKMIVVETLMDQDAFPWQADWYASKVKADQGSRFDDNFRLWYTDCAVHGDQDLQSDATRTVSYVGTLYQALRDLSVWVENGVAPPPSTNYKVVDGQVQVPPTAVARRGIQPVVTVSANGGVRADVVVGQPVTFDALIELPPDTGSVVAAEWDFEEAGKFPEVENLTNSKSSETRAILTTTHTFSKPGTYFPALRATSQRQGDAKTPYCRIQNLGRVRVIVK